MTTFEKQMLAIIPLSKETVKSCHESHYGEPRSGHIIDALCESHERLRMDVENLTKQLELLQQSMEQGLSK